MPTNHRWDNDLQWGEPQRVMRAIQFSTYLNPGNDEHINSVLESFFKAKGVIYKDGVIYPQ